MALMEEKRKVVKKRESHLLFKHQMFAVVVDYFLLSVILSKRAVLYIGSGHQL